MSVLDQLTAVLAALDDGVTVLDAAGEMVYANERAAEVCGFASAAEMLATGAAAVLGRFEMLRDDGSPLPTDDLPSRIALHGGTPSEVLVRFRVRATGAERCSMVRATAVRNDAGAIQYVVNVLVDVTARREAEESRKRLEAARAEAEHANRAKDEFLAMLGHELRNPLAPIVSALELMELRAKGQLERERSIIARQVRHMARLVDDLLDVSRITRGKIELSREVVDVGDVLGKAIEMAGPLVEERRHQLVTSIPPGLIVDGDPMRLAQLFSNLLQNAAKYTPKSGRIEVRGERVADSVVVRVRDNGIGISPETLAHVFDLFVQERQALDRAQGGLGIGLAIVRSLVALHGGNVEAHSDGLGKGSEIVVRLPASTAAVVRPAPQPARFVRVAVPSAGRVLVVDDNADALGLLAMSLEMLGYEALRASDGPSALIIAERERPEIALLDIGLPMMDGYELARRLRETPGMERMRLVAITGYGMASDRERSTAAGFDIHLVKPVTLEAVRTALQSL